MFKSAVLTVLFAAVVGGLCVIFYSKCVTPDSVVKKAPAVNLPRARIIEPPEQPLLTQGTAAAQKQLPIAQPSNRVEAQPLSVAEQASLDESKALEDEWQRRRMQFLEIDLKMTESEIALANRWRNDASEKEEHLLSETAQSELARTELRLQLVRNRQEYISSLEKLLGKERLHQFQSLFREYWKSDSSGIHSPFI